MLSVSKMLFWLRKSFQWRFSVHNDFMKSRFKKMNFWSFWDYSPKALKLKRKNEIFHKWKENKIFQEEKWKF